MMPVEGESKAATQRSAGSSCCAWVAVSHCKIIDAVCARRVGNPLDTCNLALFGGDDQLADLCVRDPVLTAKGVKAIAPGNTAARLQAAGQIIKSAMYDLAVARGGLEPDRISPVEDKYAVPRQRRRASRGKPDHARSDDHA